MENYVKELTFGKAGVERLLSGVEKLGTAVSSTLGAGGKSVILEDSSGNVIITKDGVTVANSIVLKDPVENIGANLIKEAARKTVVEAGDGTTTSTLLAWALLVEYQRSQTGTVREIKEANEEGLKFALKYIDSKSAPIKKNGKYDAKLLNSVAAISANNDEKVGKVIADAFISAGTEGTVIMGINEEPTLEIETSSGSSFPLGLKNPYFANTPAHDKAVLENGKVLLVASKIPNIARITKVLEYTYEKKVPLLIVADAENKVMTTLIMNKQKNGMDINLIDAPMMGVNRKDDFDDLATLTGATVVNENLGDSLDIMNQGVLGDFSKAVTSMNETIFTFDDPKAEVALKAEELKDRARTTPHSVIKKKIEKRVGRLLGKVSTVLVGADTEVELNELKDRVEDAICATTAAVKDGIVSGGGVTLKDIAVKLTNSKLAKTHQLKHFIKALYWPIMKVSANAGFKFEIEEKSGCGLNAIDGKVVNMKSKGIIDPALVTKSALKNAVSVANTVISTDCIINNIRI